MRRLLLNGSPRGEASNSRRILAWLSEGIESAGIIAPTVQNLAGTDNADKALEAFLAADEAVLVFPLYTDSMPGIMAAFTNALATQEPSRLHGKRVGYVVHSGFPESAQSEPLALVLRRISDRLGFVHLGTAIKGGSEGLRLNPSSGKSRTANQFRALGRSLVEGGAFDVQILEALARPRRMGRGARLLFRLLAPTGLVNFYWNIMLRKNGAWERRFDRPYAP